MRKSELQTQPKQVVVNLDIDHCTVSMTCRPLPFATTNIPPSSPPHTHNNNTKQKRRKKKKKKYSGSRNIPSLRNILQVFIYIKKKKARTSPRPDVVYL